MIVLNKHLMNAGDDQLDSKPLPEYGRSRNRVFEDEMNTEEACEEASMIIAIRAEDRVITSSE